MNNILTLLSTANDANTGNEAGTFESIITFLIPIIIFFAVFYFLVSRPQKKQEKEHAALVSSVAIGDSVLTTAGFYGVVIDVTDDTVIVEFGNNKNCRIPMQKKAIIEVEKQDQGEE